MCGAVEEFYFVNIWSNLTVEFCGYPSGRQPDWAKLDKFQGKWCQTKFFSQLEQVYCPRVEWWQAWIKKDGNKILIRKKKRSR